MPDYQEIRQVAEAIRKLKEQVSRAFVAGKGERCAEKLLTPYSAIPQELHSCSQEGQAAYRLGKCLVLVHTYDKLRQYDKVIESFRVMLCCIADQISIPSPGEEAHGIAYYLPCLRNKYAEELRGNDDMDRETALRLWATRTEPFRDDDRLCHDIPSLFSLLYIKGVILDDRKSYPGTASVIEILERIRTAHIKRPIRCGADDNAVSMGRAIACVLYSTSHHLGERAQLTNGVITHGPRGPITPLYRSTGFISYSSSMEFIQGDMPDTLAVDIVHCLLARVRSALALIHTQKLSAAINNTHGEPPLTCTGSPPRYTPSLTLNLFKAFEQCLKASAILLGGYSVILVSLALMQQDTIDYMLPKALRDAEMPPSEDGGEGENYGQKLEERCKTYIDKFPDLANGLLRAGGEITAVARILALPEMCESLSLLGEVFYEACMATTTANHPHNTVHFVELTVRAFDVLHYPTRYVPANQLNDLLEIAQKLLSLAQSRLPPTDDISSDVRQHLGDLGRLSTKLHECRVRLDYERSDGREERRDPTDSDSPNSSFSDSRGATPASKKHSWCLIL